MSKVETYQQEIRDAITELDDMTPIVGNVGRNVVAITHYSTDDQYLSANTIDLAITALRAQIDPGWIKVSEPPKVYQHDNGEPMEFIVMIKDAIVPTVLCFNGSEWFQMDWTNTRAGSSHIVTHWMPLPEPPKDGEE